MKRALKNTLYLLSIILAVSCSSVKKGAVQPVNVKPLSDTVKLREGTLVYALPRTIFTVKFEIERKTEIPGPYARYASDFLGLTDVIRDRKELWSVKSVAVNSHQEADPSEYYVIETSSSFRTNVLALKNEGLIVDLNPVSAGQGTDLIKGRELNADRFIPVDLGSDEYFQSQTDTAFRRVRVDSSFIRIPYTVEKKKRLSEEQIAERAAKRLMELRDGKVLILTGEANVYPQNNAAIDEINHMIKDYTDLFTGKTFTETRTLSFQVIPRRDQVAETSVLFRFSDSEGTVSPGSPRGIPVTVRISPEQKTKDLTVITKAQPEPASVKTEKIFYRIPEVAELTVLLGDQPVYTSRRLISQFGEIMQLPSNYIIDK